MPKISVVLPTYNRAHCLARAVRSVAAQHFEDWELVLVDDGSTDETEVLRDRFRRSLGSRYRERVSNHLGVSAARNIGIAAARGEYIAFLDSDDFWFPEKLSLQIAEFCKQPDAVFSFTDFLYFHYQSRDIVESLHWIYPELEARPYPSILELRHNVIMTPTVIARRDALIRADGFDETMSVCEDLDLWLRVNRRADRPLIAVRRKLTAVEIRTTEDFPYQTSLIGRAALYAKSVANDPSLSPMMRDLYREIFALYRGIAAAHGHSQAEQSLASALAVVDAATEPPSAAQLRELAVETAVRLGKREDQVASQTDRISNGSGGRPHESKGELLEMKPYTEAMDYARIRTRRVIPETLVSVVIPFLNEIEMVKRAASSVLAQTHSNLELILVNDGSTEPLDPIHELRRVDPRVRLLSQENKGPGAARNRGMEASRGEYIAFLDADDLFLPQKVQVQLAAMQGVGSLFSHTSYHVVFPAICDGIGMVRSGIFSGKVYPRILESCPVSIVTVMMHRSLFEAGFRLQEGYLAEDVIFLIAICQRHEVLGIDQPLSIVEWSSSSAAINLEKTVRAIGRLLRVLRADPVHSGHLEQIESLVAAEAKHRQLLETAKTSGAPGPYLNEETIDWILPGAGILRMGELQSPEPMDGDYPDRVNQLVAAIRAELDVAGTEVR